MSEEAFTKASALFSAGKYREAIANYTALASADGTPTSDKARALNNTSACYAALQDYTQSLAFAREAIALQPQNAKAIGRAATAEEGLKHYEAAVGFFEQAAALDQANEAYATGAQRCRSLVESRRGVATAEAKDEYYYTKSIEKGTAAMKAANTLEAIRHFGKALSLMPATATERERATLLCNRSAAFFRAGRMEESVGDAASAVLEDMTYARAFFRLGAAQAQLKRMEDAFDALNRCVQLDAAHVEARQLLEEVAPIALEARKTAAERARDHASRVTDIAEKMREEQAMKAATALPRGATARGSSYSYCNFCNETGHTRAECPMLRRKRARPG